MSTEAELDSPTPAPLQPHLSFWQQPLVQDLLPLGTSLLIHLLLIVVGVMMWGTYKVLTTPELREQIIIPEAAIIEGAALGGIPNPGLGGDPNLAAAQSVDRTIAVSDGWNNRRSESLTSTLMNDGGTDAALTDPILSRGPLPGLAGVGDSGTSGTGSAGGPMAPFGPPGGGIGAGLPSPFMGVSGNARKVVYICDASGSMLDVIGRVRVELQKALDVLSARQAFNVILFSDVEVTTLSRNMLVMATPDQKRKAIEMANTTPASGTTDPLPAIRIAFAQQPELIYVLTDGFENVVSFDAVVNEFRRLNADKKVKVNTILIRSTGYAELEKVMRVIASENGGVCKIIDRQAL